MSLIYINPYRFSTLSLPNIGDPFQGGYYAGLISHTANGVPTHALIVAPRATGASGTGYPLTTQYSWKTTNTATGGANSLFDGSANTADMVTSGIANHPAAQFCVNLNIGGFTDWYLPSLYEMDIAYQNLKPTTNSNNTSWGINDYSVPKRTVNRTTTVPGQTSVSIFQSSGSEAFTAGAERHWTSTQLDATSSWIFRFDSGAQLITNKNSTFLVRAFRRVAL